MTLPRSTGDLVARGAADPGPEPERGEEIFVREFSRQLADALRRPNAREAADTHRRIASALLEAGRDGCITTVMRNEP